MATTGLGVCLANDSIGRLVQVYANGGAVIVPMDYVGNQLITEMNASNQLIRRYIYSPGVDTPLVWYEGAGTTDRRWLIPDERGSIVSVTDALGNTTAINSYDEYGIPASTNLGRFMQTDPIGYGDGMNMYGYVGGDPVNATDPRGMSAAQDPPSHPSTPNGHTGCDQTGSLSGGCGPNPNNVQSNGGPFAGGGYGRGSGSTASGGSSGGTWRAWVTRATDGSVLGMSDPWFVPASGFSSISFVGGDSLFIDANYKPGGNILVPKGNRFLDPAGLNKGVSPLEMRQISNTLNILSNGDSRNVLRGLSPHAYFNFPDWTTGAVLPLSLKGYTTFYVFTGYNSAGSQRLVYDNGTSLLYYTNNHYKSFYQMISIGGN